MMSDRSNNPPPDDPLDAAGASIETTEPRMTRQHLDTDALSAFLDARLDGDLNAAAAGHIATCPDCHRELSELRTTVSLLEGLPQYRPRRSFTLGPEYAHPVRTNRLIRLLPMLPALRAAAVAVFLLLVGVGSADILTQIGEDSDDNSGPVAMTAEDPGDAAVQPPTGVDKPAAGGAPAVDIPAGDGTGGESGTAGRSASDTDGVTAGDAAEEAADDPIESSESPPLGAMPGGGNDASSAGDDADVEAPPAAAPVEESEPDSAGESGSVGETSDAERAAGDSAAVDSADDEALSEAPADSDSASNGVQSAAIPRPTIAAEPTAPAAAVVVATESPEPETEATISSADAAQTTGQRAASTSDSGISTWRLIEYILVIALVALVAIVFSLHRLNLRARRIGLIR